MFTYFMGWLKLHSVSNGGKYKEGKNQLCKQNHAVCCTLKNAPGANAGLRKGRFHIEVIF